MKKEKKLRVKRSVKSLLQVAETQLSRFCTSYILDFRRSQKFWSKICNCNVIQWRNCKHFLQDPNITPSMICNIPQVVCPGAEDLLTDLLTFSFFSSAIQSHPVSDSVNESWSPTAGSKDSLPLGPHDSHDLRVPECAGAGACNPKRNGRQSHTNSIQFVLLPSALLQPWKEKEIDPAYKEVKLREDQSINILCSCHALMHHLS